MANYLAKITAHSLAESKGKGVPYVKIIVETHKDLDRDEEIVKNLYASLWLTEKAVERTMKTLRVLGYQSDSLNDLNCTNCLCGVMCEVSTEWTEWNGQQREEVTFINEEGNRARRGFKPLDDDAAKRICNKYNAMLRGIAKGRPPKRNLAEPAIQHVAEKLGAEVDSTKPGEDELNGLPF